MVYKVSHIDIDIDFTIEYLPMMGVAPISPLSGALPWATTARVDMTFGAVAMAPAAEVIDITTAAVYECLAAIAAA